MNLAKLAIENKTVTLVFTFVMLFGGALSFQGLARLEDPEFTIKTALVITQYPGATPMEVEEEVTDVLEQAVQKMGQVDYVTSRSERGYSEITVEIKKNYDKTTLPQVWDELRRKISDAQSELPPGAGSSLVVDDFGDVYGIFFAIYGAEYTFKELQDYSDILRKELLLVDDVAKIEVVSYRREAVYVELDRDRMSQLGISTQIIINELQQKNLVSDAGRVRVGREFIAIEPSGVMTQVSDFENLLISGGSSGQVYLRDVADVRRGYVEPDMTRLRYDSNPAVGLGISTVAGGNVVTMGLAVEERLKELESQRPLGIEFGVIAFQANEVTKSIDSFVTSLVQAVVIVIIVLLFFMGVRSGLLIGFVLFLTIAGTFVFMAPQGIALERISLGALIIALGMLVDNAIVVVDGMLTRLQKGMDATEAAIEVVGQNQWPLFGATIVAILAFAAIGTSQDSTGEYTRSLYQVILISLSLSWVTGLTVTPLLCVMFLKAPKVKDGVTDPYDTKFYHAYKGILRTGIKNRWSSISIVIALFAVSLWGFQFVEQTFFPDSTRPQFMVDIWLPQGTHIDETTSVVEELEEILLAQEAVTHVTSTVGTGPIRFMLTLSSERPNTAYAEIIVDVKSYEDIAPLRELIEERLEKNHPEVLGYTNLFALGASGGADIEVRLTGEDPRILRMLSLQIQEIYRSDPAAKAIREDWRQQVKVLRPIVAEEQANLNGITREAIAGAIRESFEGQTVGLYREGEDLLPIILRAPESTRSSVDEINNVQIWSPAAQRMIPLRQVVSSFETDIEDDIIYRRNRKRTLTVQADTKYGSTTKLFGRLRPLIEAIDPPPGYELEWGGEFESSGDAQAALMGSLPIFFGMMVLIVIMLFNNLRQPLVIFLTVPLAMIGVTFGLLVTSNAFGFMALLGMLSLSGMLIKNAVVLIDQINLELKSGAKPFDAILNSGSSRLRPVFLAALTTALGMIPLIPDNFFVSLAITVIFGLMFATVLTMIVVPILYALVYGIHEDREPEMPVTAE